MDPCCGTSTAVSNCPCLALPVRFVSCLLCCTDRPRINRLNLPRHGQIPCGCSLLGRQFDVLCPSYRGYVGNWGSNFIGAANPVCPLVQPVPYGGTINLTRAIIFEGANQNKSVDCYNATLPLGPKPILYGLPVGTTTAGTSQCYFHHSRAQPKQTLVHR
jgi:hypothetical protein